MVNCFLILWIRYKAFGNKPMDLNILPYRCIISKPKLNSLISMSISGAIRPFVRLVSKTAALSLFEDPTRNIYHATERRVNHC